MEIYIPILAAIIGAFISFGLNNWRAKEKDKKTAMELEKLEAEEAKHKQISSKTSDINLEGVWNYEVESISDAGRSHFGTCSIKQNGATLIFDGVRKETKTDGHRKKDEMPWKSSWAQICEDNQIRAEYSIELENVIIGYFTLNIPEDNKNEMIGKYYQLTPHLMFGKVKFERNPQI